MEGSASTSDVVRSNETLGERLHKIAKEKTSIYENYALITDKIFEKLPEKLEYYASAGAFSAVIDTETVLSYGLDGNNVKLSDDFRKYFFDTLQQWGTVTTSRSMSSRLTLCIPHLSPSAGNPVSLYNK